MATAPTTPVSWILAPACSATAVRDPLVLTGKPWKRPAARLAAPMPIISWLASTSWPVRAANADEVEMVSVSDTSVMPSAPGHQQRTGRPSSTLGTVNGGKPWGSVADQRHALARRGRRRRRPRWPPTTATSTPGTLGATLAEHQDDRPGRPRPTASAAATVSPSATPSTKPRELVDEAVGVDGEAEELGQLAHQDREGEPVHVADLGRLGEQVGDEAELADAGADHADGDEDRQHRRERDRLRRIAVGADQREDRRRDHRPERRVRAEDEDARRPEHGVAEQAHDRGVEAGDRRQAGQLRVGHALGHQQRGQHEAGHDVLGQPGAVVGAERRDARDVLLHAASRHRHDRCARRSTIRPRSRV